MNPPTPPSKEEALRVARSLRDRLQSKGYPIREVRLYGSAARGKAHTWSDIDLAVLCTPFLASRHEENVRFFLEGKEVDLRIETICLRPEDLNNKYLSIAQEVKKHGIVV